MTKRRSAAEVDLGASVLAAWRTNNLVTSNLVEAIPNPLWTSPIPGSPRKTVRMLAVHLHNARARWIRTLATPHGIKAPALIDRHRAARRDVLAALKRSAAGIDALLRLGLENGNSIPPSPAYVWRNLPLDVGHVVSYFVAHEAHHRGQLLMTARALGQRLPASVTNALWQWSALNAD